MPQKKGEEHPLWMGGRKATTERFQKKHKERIKKKAHQRYLENKKYLRAQRRAWAMKNPYKRWAIDVRSSHRHGEYEIKISNMELEKMAKEANRCLYCDHILDYTPYQGRRTHAPTIDRIKNGKLIAAETVRIICKKCNITKQDRTHDEFVEYCNSIVERFGTIRNED